jgi:hypothetical protein
VIRWTNARPDYRGGAMPRRQTLLEIRLREAAEKKRARNPQEANC